MAKNPQGAEFDNAPLVHICEVCGVAETMTPKDAYHEGWDYPPLLGAFGVLSPRTCGECGIDKTLYFRILQAKQRGVEYQLTEADLALIERITNEPTSIQP